MPGRSRNAHAAPNIISIPQLALAGTFCSCWVMGLDPESAMNYAKGGVRVCMKALVAGRGGSRRLGLEYPAPSP